MSAPTSTSPGPSLVLASAFARAGALGAVILFAACQGPSGSDAASDEPSATDAIVSRIVRTAAEDLIVEQTVFVDAPVAQVWAAYTTEAGWQAWAAPVVEIDLRAGGTIRTNYAPGAAIGDPGTNTLHILNLVPERVLTLQAELDQNWPEVMQQDAGRLMNLVLFEALAPERTKITSYGLGYRDSPEYDALMSFFVPANEGLYAGLKQYLED
ncbi:hypothetical protein Pla163_08730 [Planctomycetes bacterium Pla163]|uniref:Activator of Hsp90 ATPase homologue 1/2-like C-terminal domain-containing protein n=1 Tax=Rohdeia mirabilis TaxID=2528008 RepID=A0A518CX07_9BACT|nr:hypothetical protein Pla163_08730 [Planctomycetes bacterium Pla163]